jgi:hypothetical protein
MQTYSLSELSALTRQELFHLHARIVTELASLTDVERPLALETLRAIRRALRHPRNAPH